VGPPQVAIGRASGGTPAKPGFLRNKKCAQIMLCKKKHYTRLFPDTRLEFAESQAGIPNLVIAETAVLKTFATF
jgi:hypothetical protein